MKKYLLISLILISCFLLVGCFKGYVSSEGKVLKKYLAPRNLKKLVENPDESIWIIDVRPLSAYKRGHIPTAKSFPSSAILSRLNEIPKDRYLIFYCETGGRAQRVINKLEEKGYSRMMNWGGYRRWKYGFTKEAEATYTKISVKQLNRMLPDKDFPLINVHIPYAGEIPQTDLFIPYNEIKENTDKLPMAKDAKLVIYCRSGPMSATAATTLLKLGYTRVFDVAGGMRAWQAEGYRLIMEPK